MIDAPQPPHKSSGFTEDACKVRGVAAPAATLQERGEPEDSDGGRGRGRGRGGCVSSLVSGSVLLCSKQTGNLGLNTKQSAIQCRLCHLLKVFFAQVSPPECRSDFHCLWIFFGLLS